MLERIGMKKIILSIILIVLSFMSFGCAATPILRYTPVMPKSPPTNIFIYVSDFKDSRPNKGTGIIGDVINGVGMRVADIKEPPNVIQWITGSFKEELRNAGYQISSNEASLNIEGDVLNISSLVSFTYEGTIFIKIRLKRAGDVILNKTYRGNSSKLGMTEFSLDISTGCEKVLNKSLQQVIQQAIADIDKILKK